MTHAALRGRTALVTGAGRGAGAAASRALSRAGASVVIADHDGPALAALAAAITAAGGHAVAVPMDPSSPVSVRRLVEQTLGAFGRLDAAVNHGGAQEASLAMAYEIPAMRRAGGGRVVNVAPSAGPPDDAVLDLTRAAARAHAGSGVQVNAVAMGGSCAPAEVARAVVWLCSDENPLVTGETWPRTSP